MNPVMDLPERVARRRAVDDDRLVTAWSSLSPVVHPGTNLDVLRAAETSAESAFGQQVQEPSLKARHGFRTISIMSNLGQWLLL